MEYKYTLGGTTKHSLD